MATAATQEATVVTADRTVESDTVAPNETVNVTVTVNLGDGADSVDDDSKLAVSEFFDTSFEQTETGYDSVSYNGERIIPSTRFGDQDGVIVGVTPDRTPNGTFASGDQLTVEYTVRVPENASEGDTFGLDGSVRLGDAETEIGGTDTLTVPESGGSQSDGETAGGGDTSSPPAEFLVSSPVETPLVATQGDEVELEGVVRNEGSQSGTRAVEIRLDNRTVQNTSVRLATAERQRVTATVDTADLNGTYTYSITTADDTAQGTLEVTTAPVAFRVANLTNVSTVADDDLSVAVDVRNVGQERGEADVAFRLENPAGEVRRNETRTGVELGGGESRTVAFEDVSTAGLDPGTYQYAVSVGDRTVSESVTVESRSDSQTATDGGSDADAPTQTETSTDDEQVESSGAGLLPLVGVLALVAALGLGAVLYRSRT